MNILLLHYDVRDPLSVEDSGCAVSGLRLEVVMAMVLPMVGVSLITESCLELLAASPSSFTFFFCRCATMDRAEGSSYLENMGEG